MSINSASILVTGGKGFVGRSLVKGLVGTGQSVRIFSRTETKPDHPNISIFRGDLTCRRDLEAAVHGCKAIFHCAAEKTRANLMTAVNVTATQQLFEFAKRIGIGYFCHLSSVGVIGLPHVKLVDEGTPCNPTNQYEATKLAAEDIVREGLSHGKVVILRPTIILGAERLRPMLVRSLRSRAHTFLKGNECAHFVYVDDVAAAAIHWMRAPARNAVETFIVSSDEESGATYREIQEFLAFRFQVAPRPFKWSAPLWMPYWARLMRDGKANYGDVVYSSQKIIGAGFRFPFGLAAGLREAADLLLGSRNRGGFP